MLPAQPRRHSVYRTLFLACVALGLSACSGVVDTRGNLPDPETVLEVQPGVHDRDQVATILGSPSTVGTFEDDTWYYISKRTEQFAFLEPEVIDQQVLMVKFGDDGLVNDMQIYGVEDGQIIEPVERTTPTSGRELTILQQLFGNLGRFNTADQQ
jgi:outer membrane protein assembly factor BamE (lipoprotein component of BamABCDE complex)